MSGLHQVRGRTAIVADTDPAIHKAITRLGKNEGFQVQSLSGYAEFAIWVNGQSMCPSLEGRELCLVMDVSALGALEVGDLPAALRDIPKIYIGVPNFSCELSKVARTGFFDFIEKPFSMERIKRSMLEAFAQHARVLSGSRIVAERLGRLSKREYEVGSHVVKGLTNQEIGSRLGISIKTVKAHRAKVMDKTESDNLVDLVRCFDSFSGLGSEAY